MQDGTASYGRKSDMNWLLGGLLTIGITVGAASAADAEWAGTPAVQALYERAKKEGEVIFWGPQQREVAWVPEAFATVFPAIEVKTLGDGDIATKAIAEARAGRHQVDVFFSAYPSMLLLVQRGLLAQQDWSMFGVTARDVAYEGRVGFTHTIAYSVVYHREKVKESDLPQHWTELLDERYKGKMVSSPFLLPRMLASIGMDWGEERVLQFARDLVTQTDIMLTRAPRESLLQSGERLYAIAEIEVQARLWALEGIPVGFVIPDPAVIVPLGVGVMAKAPHPNAARLLAGWMASVEGRRARKIAVFSGDYRQGSEDPLVKQLEARGAKILVDDVAHVAARQKLMNRLSPIISGQAR